MDHYAAMLAAHLPNTEAVQCSVVRPPFRDRLGRLAFPGPRHARTLDCYWNRYLDHPAWAAGMRDFDLFHIVDQTYAYTATRLPAGRVIVTCHDLDFVEPPPGTRKAWLVRATGRLALSGLRLAARILCDSDAIRAEIVRRGWADDSRLVVVPLGVEDEFRPDGPRELPADVELSLTRGGAGPRLLHVGGMVARKRIDLLLRTFAAIRRAVPGATLMRAGGPLSPAMNALACELDIEHAIIPLPFLSRAQLAAVFRRADLFLLTSDREGFGLPVLESMASGVPVVSRDLPAVREVAGDAVRLVAEADPEALAAAAVALLRDPATLATLRQRGLERAAGFRWAHTSRRTAKVYEEILTAVPVGAERAGLSTNSR